MKTKTLSHILPFAQKVKTLPLICLLTFSCTSHEIDILDSEDETLPPCHKVKSSDIKRLLGSNLDDFLDTFGNETCYVFDGPDRSEPVTHCDFCAVGPNFLGDSCCRIGSHSRRFRFDAAFTGNEIRELFYRPDNLSFSINSLAEFNLEPRWPDEVHFVSQPKTTWDNLVDGEDYQIMIWREMNGFSEIIMRSSNPFEKIDFLLIINDSSRSFSHHNNQYRPADWEGCFEGSPRCEDSYGFHEEAGGVCF